MRIKPLHLPAADSGRLVAHRPGSRGSLAARPQIAAIRWTAQIRIHMFP